MRALVCILAAALALPSVAVAEDRNVVILHSYQYDYEWTRLQHTGIMSAFEGAEDGALLSKTEYLAATRFLDDIVERIELEPIPAPFRGAPIRFISAGLMALAFAGVDAGFFARFSG